MSRKLYAWGLAALLVALVVTLGCGGGAEDDAAAQAADREAALAELQQQKAELDAARQELEALQSEIATQDEDAEPPAEGEDAAAVEDPEARLNQLLSKVDTQTEDFNSALISFLQGEEMLEGEEPTDAQKAALRMKSQEDMLIAREYIERGGNYRQAIDIYRNALALDPEYEELQIALAEAEANRYMSEERFAQVEEQMTEDEVREVLGTPFHANVRPFDEGVVAWFYPTDAAGSAAAVWFRPRNDELQVYKTNYEEIVKEGPTVVGGDDGGDSEAEAEAPAEG